MSKYIGKGEIRIVAMNSDGDLVRGFHGVKASDSVKYLEVRSVFKRMRLAIEKG